MARPRLSRALKNRILVNASLFASCVKPFRKVFNEELRDFWKDNNYGFDIPRFLEKWQATPADIVAKIEAAHGEHGVAVLSLLCRMKPKNKRVRDYMQAIRMKSILQGSKAERESWDET
jgi:hypothetical protein